MSKFDSLKRQISFLREIQKQNRDGNYPAASELQKIFNVKRATFFRDIKEIKQYFTSNLRLDTKEKGYLIDSEIDDEALLILETFELLSFIYDTGGVNDFIIPEKRKSKGTEHFFILKKCIEEQKEISFQHHDYLTDTSKTYSVQPLGLKESRERWYLLGSRKEDNALKSYGLDRMESIRETGEVFNQKLDKSNAIKKYDACFAMFTTDDAAQNVVLSYDKRDGNYIKSFPIHHSQTITETESRVIVNLKIKITTDFIMELMSRAWSIKVIEPIALREKLHDYFKEAMERNKQSI
jgi:proteasome accessory factor B